VALCHFKNVYRGRYVIYRMKNGDVIYFTGDEVDWETRLRLIGANFTFNADERAKIAKILWPVMEDGTEVARAHETGETRMSGDHGMASQSQRL
jgi:hypothetical protein